MDRESLWKLFTKKGPYIATCNTCHKDYNYKAHSNLRKHWNKVHGKNRKVRPSDMSESDRHISDNSDVEQEKATDKKPKATWNYFDVVDSDKFEATCKICEKVVPFTSSLDLTQHIREEHDENPKDSDEEYVPVIPKDNTFTRKHFKSKVWKYFTATNDKMAVCLLCKNLFNYGSTITNLRKHLVRKHNGATTPSREDREKMFRIGDDGTLYEIEHLSGQEDNEDGNAEDPMATDTIYLNEEELDFIDDQEEPPTPSPKKPCITKSNYIKSSKEPIHDAEELSKITDVWRYFETDSSNKAQCVVCKNSVVKEYENLKAHLKESHPDLLLGLLQDQTSDAGSNNGNEDNDNTYTEIVYLEREPSTETVTKRKEKPKPYLKPLKKRERQESVNSFENVPVKKAKNEEEDDELTTFIKYITCLLKKLPSDVFTNVQIEIINAILKANNQANAANTSQSIALNKELVNTSSNIITVDGITPLSSTVMGHHNYTITVAPPKESDTENS